MQKEPFAENPNAAGRDPLDWLDAPAPEEIPRPRVLTVSDLTRQIRELLEYELGHVTVEGEISNWRVAGSGHAYFLLKDERACIRCVMFRYAAARLKFQPCDGCKVEVSGLLSVYEARGEYQILVESIAEQGVGALFEAFMRLKEKLEREGLFDPAHKTALPFLPRCVGIVTSPTGAAIRDVLNVLGRRFANLHVLIWPVRVQGAGAAAVIAHAIGEMDRRQLADVIICGRGGGSIEDLWAFNEEVVARAIYACGTPIISAVGHEIDFTIADFVADLRAPTPSAAAELVVGNQLEIAERLRTCRRRLDQAVLGRVRYLRSHLRGLLQSYALEQPRHRLAQLQQHTDELLTRLDRCAFQARALGSQRLGAGRQRLRASARAWRRTADATLADRQRRIHRAAFEQIARTRLRLAGLLESLDLLGPDATLRRGYSLVTKRRTGEIVRAARQVKMNDVLDIRTGDGTFPALGAPPLRAEQGDFLSESDGM